MKKFLIGAVALAAMTAGSASATELLSNGDFSAGNSGFYSEYSYAVTHDLWPASTYDVITDPNNDHSSFTHLSDHTPTSDGLMMVINGAGVPDTVVWAQGEGAGGSALAAANTAFTFSFWLAAVYTDSPANLQLWINEEMVTVLSPTGQSPNFLNTAGLGNWQQFTYSGVTGAQGIKTIGITNKNLEPSGNDFALDDFSLSGTAVPEPASWGLMIVGFGAMGSMLRSTRRRAALAA